jgi:hypothetical protein
MIARKGAIDQTGARLYFFPDPEIQSIYFRTGGKGCLASFAHQTAQDGPG